MFFILIFRQRFSCWLNIVGTTSDTNVVFTLTNNTKRHQAAARFNVNTLRSTLSLLHIHTNMYHPPTLGRGWFFPAHHGLETSIPSYLPSAFHKGQRSNYGYSVDPIPNYLFPTE